MDKNDVIAWLRQQSDKTFFEVVYESAVGRGPDEHDRAWRDSHVVLGYAVREKSDDARASPWSSELVALPRDAVWPDDDNALLCQSGTHCGHELISWAKEIRCPLCGEEAYAT